MFFSGCPPKAQASNGANEVCAAESASSSMPAEESPLNGALIQVLKTVPARICTLQKRCSCPVSSPLSSCCSGRIFMCRQPLFPLVEGRWWFPEGWPLATHSQHCCSAAQPLLYWVPVFDKFWVFEQIEQKFPNRNLTIAINTFLVVFYALSTKSLNARPRQPPVWPCWVHLVAIT